MEQRNQAETEEVIEAGRDMLDVFRFPIHPRNREEGVTIDDYREHLEQKVKVPLCVVYTNLCELISGLPPDDMDKADAYISIFKSVMTLWEVIDERVTGTAPPAMRMI